MVFAFGGVLLSTLAIGLLVSMLALVGLQGLNLTFLECMMYGAILSSTDPGMIS